MNKTRLLACLLLMLSLAGNVRRPDRQTGVMPRTLHPEPSARRQFLRARLKTTGDQFRDGFFVSANAGSLDGYRASLQSGARDLASRFLSNSCACRFALHQYRDALDCFFAARSLARSAGDAGTAVGLAVNISSVYEQMGELDSAVAWAETAVAEGRPVSGARHLPKVLIQLASLRARQGRMGEAEELFVRGIRGAEAAGDLNTYALGWDRLGEERFKGGDLAGAEPAMLEAFRVRRLHGLAALDTSYRNLGRLRLAQGDLHLAAALLDEAVARSHRPKGLMPTWELYHARALVRLSEHRYPEALADLRIAVRLARTWRRTVSPSDATRISSEQLIESVYSSCMEAALAVYRRTGARELVREAFEAAEENRAASLRALVASRHREALPPEYWELLAHFQAAEANSLRAGGPGAEAALQRWRTALVALENRSAGLEVPSPEDLAATLQRRLPEGAAYLSFHLGDTRSYVWAVDRSGLAVNELPGRREIAVAVDRFTESVRAGGDVAASGAPLYTALFAHLAPRFRRASRWLLSLDDKLFTLPLAALPDGRGFLVERHSLEIVPAAAMLAAARGESWPGRLDGAFLGLGDPVYNTADARWQQPGGTRRAVRSRWQASASGTQDLHLPRLVASGRELESCAGAWGRREPLLLVGAAASKASFQRALAARPAVIHFATHILRSAERPYRGLIALSLDSAGQSEILDPAEIAAWRIQAGLVTLSGCGSGAAEALPGSGLLGLTRAWMAAGAAAVAATRWPTADESGELFRSLYRHLSRRPQDGPAAALQRAQIDMLRTGSWRAEPRYWGAYFLVAGQ